MSASIGIGPRGPQGPTGVSPWTSSYTSASKIFHPLLSRFLGSRFERILLKFAVFFPPFSVVEQFKCFFPSFFSLNVAIFFPEHRFLSYRNLHVCHRPYIGYNHDTMDAFHCLRFSFVSFGVESRVCVGRLRRVGGYGGRKRWVEISRVLLYM